MKFEKGMRVKVFDHTLYKNDKDTPLSMTMKPATVIKGEYPYYGFALEHTGDKVIDVNFDHRGESKAHFVWAVEHLDEE